ncbi:MAG: AIR synthase family protein [Abditibacteriales bacterium]|nr:AIR synthase family protein [Abditibacteriales bacterium]MDW8364246.1 AIR synthase family protein [Abditibacteriales bacterium]
MSIFPVGKLPASVLEKMLTRFRVHDERVVVGPRLGEDAAALNFGDRYLIVKSDPITFATDELGWYAVVVNANDIACRGATPQWFLPTLLLPEGKTDEAMVEAIFGQIADACAALNIAVIGGHTEITYGLDRPILSGHMLGEVAKEKLVTTSGARVGDAVILTKGIPIEGTSIVAREKEPELRRAGVPPALIERAKNYLHHPGISVVKDALLAVNTVNVHCLHDPTEGGLATGLREVAVAANVGLRIAAENITILEESKALLSVFGLDPMGTIASGALLLTVAPEEVDALLSAFQQARISANVIGEVVPIEQGMTLQRGGKDTPLPTFEADEIARLF